jgi:subtilisin family serine protease
MKCRQRTMATLAWGLAVAFMTQPVLAKEKIESVTDLPVRSYASEIAPSQMLGDFVLMDALRTQVRIDIEGILERYDLEDAATLRRFYGVLSMIALLEARNSDAALNWEKVRELEEKEAARYMTGLNGASLVAARKAGEPGSQAYTSAFAATYAARLGSMPWDVVQDEVQSRKGRTEILTENVIRGIVQSNMDPVVAETGELNDEMAESLLGIQLTLRDYLPLRAVQLAALQKLVDAHQVEKVDIWPGRSVTLAPDAGYAPVVVGIWDSGVDAQVFPQQMWANTAEMYNGLDDDGNGFIDDIHGIAYDMFGARHPNLLHPHGDMTGRVESSMKYMKGITDLQAAIDSPEASELKQHLGSMEPSAVNGFLTALGFTGLYAHGTHVAGIATAGNPFARVLCARISFDYHPVPAPILIEAARAPAKSYAETVAYFRAAGVRAVNMSWGWTFDEVEAGLEANGIGASAEERKAMTEKIFGTLDKGLHDAMASAPEILFVIAAGNDDSDVAFERVIPSAYELENIMVVGAVDQAGERTSFTSMGENVVVYANGFEVESYVPGGERMAFSGTSMASPNALNLAVKMFTVQPGLQPSEVIKLIERGADELEGQLGLKLLNPAASLALLQSKQASD